MVRLRPYRQDDAPELLALFRDTIRRVNSRDYSPAQVAAWASDDIDTVCWFGRFSGRYVRQSLKRLRCLDGEMIKG